MPKWLLYSFISILAWGAWGVVTKVASNMMSPAMLQAVSTLGLIPPALVALKTHKGQPGDKGDNLSLGLFFGFLTGLFGGFGNIAVFAAFKAGGPASTITPLTAVYPVVTIIIALALLRERLNWVQGVGMALSLVAMVLLNP